MVAVTVAKCLLESKYAEAAQTTQVTAAAATRLIVDKFTVSNNSGAVATIAINVVPSGGSAGASNLITPPVGIASGTVYSASEMVGRVLNAGDFISTVAGTGSALVIRIEGREISGTGI